MRNLIGVAVGMMITGLALAELMSFLHRFGW